MVTHSDLIAVEKAFKALRECYCSKLDGLDREASFIHDTLIYAIDVLDLHLNLIRLDYEQTLNKMAKDMEKPE